MAWAIASKLLPLPEAIIPSRKGEQRVSSDSLNGCVEGCVEGCIELSGDTSAVDEKGPDESGPEEKVGIEERHRGAKAKGKVAPI